MTTLSVRETVEQLELSYIVDGNAKYYKQFGKQFGNFLWSLTYTYHMTQ